MKEIVAVIYALVSAVIVTSVMVFKKCFSSGWMEGIEISWEMVKVIYTSRITNFLSQDVTNHCIPESLKVIELESKKEVSLKSICESSPLPVVLNFGSCT